MNSSERSRGRNPPLLDSFPGWGVCWLVGAGQARAGFLTRKDVDQTEQKLIREGKIEGRVLDRVNETKICRMCLKPHTHRNAAGARHMYCEVCVTLCVQCGKAPRVNNTTYCRSCKNTKQRGYIEFEKKRRHASNAKKEI